MSKLPDLTISDIASELRIRREATVKLVTSGALEAYDVTPPGAKRKSYRITRQALDEFKAWRSVQQQAKTARRRAKPIRDANFVEYFQ